MATFIDAVNRILRINSVIRGDDDAITTFSDTQHSSDIQLAQIAVQDEITDIVAERMLPYEHTTATISLVASQRTYTLESDFIRFFGLPSFYDSIDNRRLYEYPGGEKDLMNTDYLYKTNTATPLYWYWNNTTTKSVGFYSVPQSSYDGRSLSYDYEKSVIVSNSTDTMPFHNTEENYAFDSMAARRFYFMTHDKDLGLLSNDATYLSAKTRLYALIRPSDPVGNYGKRYRSIS